MSSSLKLSICIPTCNSSEKLRVALSQLIPQMTSECELNIRDDSENDSLTQILRASTAKKRLKISLFRGHKIGVDLANLSLLEKANGKYVWWLNDNDELNKETIKRIIEIIDGNKDITFVWLNFLSAPSGNIALTDKNDGFLRDSGEFFDLMGLYFFNHPDSMQTIGKNSKSRAIEKVSEAFEVFAINFPDTCRPFEDKLNQKSIRCLIARNLCHFWRGVFICIAKGYDTVGGKRKKLMQRYWWHRNFYQHFFMHVPRALLNGIYKIYKTLSAKSIQGP